MIRSSLIARVGVAAAAGGLMLGLSALPAGSQVVPQDPLVVAGTAECQVVDGNYVWAVEYTATNTLSLVPTNGPAALGDIDITSQTITLDGGPAGTTNLQPNPVPVGETATDGGNIPGTLTGTLVLTVEWTASSVDDSGTAEVTLVLDDSCHAPATTTTTAPAPAVQAAAVAVNPAFTG